MFTPTLLSTLVWRVTGAVSRLELRAGEENTVVSEPKLFHFLSFHPHSDGLLYGVCQYEIDHEKLVSQVEYSVTPGVRSVSVSWSTCDTCPGWRPSHVSLTACNTGGVEDDEQRGLCVDLETRMDDQDSVVVSGLETFSEYELKLSSRLDYFNVSSSSLVRARTSKFH